MTDLNPKFSLKTAALIAGFVSLIMVISAPFAEIYADPKLVIPGNEEQTIKNILAHQTLFGAMIMGYIITFTGDIIVAWALYILLRPVQNYLSVLTALFRLVFAVIGIAALLNLTYAFRIATNPEYLKILHDGQLQLAVTLSLNAFKYGFHFGLIFFGIHLGLLGYLFCGQNTFLQSWACCCLFQAWVTFFQLYSPFFSL